ncbi:hypothetical protein FDP41_004235 [Naegleria fowleri]|uniref:Uncharacterized protein n=1 Tax=Naegleria fowleri TaxID=5763 RepID=A0A6A5BT37_NAEFO|nr:uncharacterized protein FDP41_004235 [Naegleria fowleri]KAF0976940.1 hypothetical protein FDP41_004235 [Naegleria fowleri]
MRSLGQLLDSNNSCNDYIDFYLSLSFASSSIEHKQGEEEINKEEDQHFECSSSPCLSSQPETSSLKKQRRRRKYKKTVINLDDYEVEDSSSKKDCELPRNEEHYYELNQFNSESRKQFENVVNSLTSIHKFQEIKIDFQKFEQH